MADFDYRKYYLSEEESERIFRRRIVPREIAGKAEPVDRPVAVFVTAQPGAGKTQLTEAVVESLADSGGCVQINSDTYKPHHPKWHQLLAEDDVTAAPYTSADGRRWMAKAEAYSAEHRLNVVLETTVRDPSVFREPIDRLRAAGYRIEIAALAVPEATSQMGILSRYAQQVQDKGSGRLTEQSNHDESYRLMAEAIAREDAHPTVDALSLWRRDNQLLYSNVVEDGHWVAPAAAGQVLDAERSRQWTYPEAVAFLGDVDAMAARLPPELQPRLDRVRAASQTNLPPGASAAHRAAHSYPQVARPFDRSAPAAGRYEAVLQERHSDPRHLFGSSGSGR